MRFMSDVPLLRRAALREAGRIRIDHHGYLWRSAGIYVWGATAMLQLCEINVTKPRETGGFLGKIGLTVYDRPGSKR
jgi:hypothetical protein